MSAEDNFNIAVRYRTVRKHLDSLGYKHAVTLDAIPLIEKLLADLLQTTESLKHFKSIAQENIEAHSQLQLAVDPYKCDNARLVQECNQLHLDLIKEKENHQRQIKDLKKEIYKLEHECNDLQLASSHNLHRIKELEVESSKKSKKILELQGKCLKPTISNVGLASKKRSCYPLRRPVLESEPLPKAVTKTNPLPNLSIVEPKVVDLLSMADHRMNCLTHEVTKLKGELSIQTDNVQMLKTQLTIKEKEIIRLKKMLEGGRPYSAVSKDCACKMAENNFISGDNVDTNELKILQQEKLELEQQLKEALNKQHDAMSQALKLADRNEELEKELRDIDHIALAVEADCNSAVKENNKRVSKLQQKLEDAMTQVHVLEGELTVERRELRADLEACRLEKHNVQRNLESTLNEKKQMTDRINELTVIEKNLNDEIERLAKENEKQRQDIIQLQYTNKLLKEQIQTNEIVQDNDVVNLKGVSERGKKNGCNRGQNGIEVQNVYKERDTQNVNGIGYENILKQLHEKETQISNFRQAVEQLKKERDFYKNEYNSVKDYHSKAIEKDHVDLWTRIRELKHQLSEKESILDELQREKKELLREKNNLETRLQDYKTDYKMLYRPCNVCKRGTTCNCSPSTMNDSNKTKNIIERLEHERDIVRADVERLIEERDALRERLKMAAEAHTSEQRRLRENLTEVETRLKQIEKERQDLLLTQGTRKATINGLEDQLQDLQEELKRTKQELATQRTQYFQLRALQDQTDQALGDAQNQLTQSEAELNKALDRNRTIERQQLQFENQVKELQQEIINLKTNMTHLDHEKDQLLMVLDEKTERIATLDKEIALKEQQVMGSGQQIRELQHKNEICVDQSAEQERQLRAMQLELENLQRQLQTSTYDRENVTQENRRVQDDLAAVTCEVRNLQRELKSSRAESLDLKRQLQTYVSEVRRAEELLNRKENERTEMLNHFRSLSLEATVLENNNHSLESEAVEARGALQSARDRLLDLEQQLADRDCLIRGYETQINELTQNVASMETQLRQQAEQRQRTEADLTAVRDLCVKLDQQKDRLMQQLDDKDALKTQYDMQIAKLKAEQTIIQDQMNRDRATVEKLEMLLDQARQESITMQTNNQELQNEMSRLRQKMSELQNKLSSESAKLRQYQTQSAEYCKQISELRRQVTNERFDRARKEEESRRYSEVPSDSFLQTPVSLPNNQSSNESNDITHRYLQNERSGKRDVVTESSKMKTANSFAVSRAEYPNEENNYKCSKYLKEIQCDVPCINIILRSDCKAKHKQVPGNNGINKKDLDTSYVLLFDTSKKKYDLTAFNTKDRLDLSQPTVVQYETKHDRNNKKSISSNALEVPCSSISPVHYHSVCINEISKSDKIWSNPIKQKSMYSRDTETNLNQVTSLTKEATKAVDINDKLKISMDTSTPPIENTTESYKKLFSKVPPISKSSNFDRRKADENEKIYTRLKADLSSKLNEADVAKVDSEKTLQKHLESGMKMTDHRIFKEYSQTAPLTASYTNKTLMKNKEIEATSCANQSPHIYSCKKNYEKNIISQNRVQNVFDKFTLQTKQLEDFSSQKSFDICNNTNCDLTNNSTLNVGKKEPAMDVKFMGTADNYFESRRNFYYSKLEQKPTKADTLDTLGNTLNGIKRLNRFAIKDNLQDYQSKDVKCKSIADNYRSAKNEVTTTNFDKSFPMSSKLMKPELMKMLMEIKERTKTLEEQLIITNRNMKIKKKTNEKNISICERSINPISPEKTIYNNKQKDIITQEPEKENVCIQEPSENDISYIKCVQDPFIKFDTQEVKNQDMILEQSDKKQDYKERVVQGNQNYEKFHDINIKSNEDKNQQISRKLLKYYNISNLEKIQTVQSQSLKSASSFTSNNSNFRPLAASTPRKANLIADEEIFYPVSYCVQNNPVSNKKIQLRQDKEVTLNELTKHSSRSKENIIDLMSSSGKEKFSTCQNKTVIMLLLTRDVNNTYLKSKYKKLEFTNFRPKCIIDSCIAYNEGLINFRSLRRKAQIPTVFRQLKSIKCKRKQSFNSKKSSYDDFVKQPIKDLKVSDLLTTAYTQSSNLYITTATSVSCIAFNENYNEERAKTGGCILS